MATYTAEQIQAQREIVARVAAKGIGHGPRFAHIGTFRNSPRGKVRFLGIRFYETADLLCQALEHRCWFESVEVIEIRAA